MCKKPLVSLLLLIVCALRSIALEVPSKPLSRINDYANVLSASQKSLLESKLKSYEEETGNQIAVAIFSSLGGESLEDFSIRLAERWKVGTKLRDNGAILLIFVNDRKMRIEVGYGLEASLTDARAISITHSIIRPRFQAGDFFGGINAGLDAMITTTGEGSIATSGSVRKRSRGAAQNSTPLLVFGIIFLFFFLPTLLSALSGRRRWYGTFGPRGWSSGGWRGFGGGFSGGGGSSGFSPGGGSFGGGGASDSW